MSEPRLLPEECVANYRAIGFKPVQGILYEYSDRKACGIGAYCFANGATITPGCSVILLAFLHFGESYVHGFEKGFDECQHEKGHSDPVRYRQGIEDGRACRAAVLAIDWDAPLVELPKQAVSSPASHYAIAK